MSKNDTLFCYQKMKYNFSSPITHTISCNRQLVVVMANKHILKVNLSKSSQINETNVLEYTRGYRIFNVFLDPLGIFVFLSCIPVKGNTNNARILALCDQSDHCKQVGTLNGLLLTSMQWLPCSASPVRPDKPYSLLATASNGLILLLTYQHSEPANISIKTLIDLKTYICHISFHCVTLADGESSVLLCFVALCDQLLVFHSCFTHHLTTDLSAVCSESRLQNLFTQTVCVINSKNTWPFSRLSTYHQNYGQPEVDASFVSFAWLTDSQLTYGQFDIGSLHSDPDAINNCVNIHERHKFQAPSTCGPANQPQSVQWRDTAVVVTAFHCFLYLPLTIRPQAYAECEPTHELFVLNIVSGTVVHRNVFDYQVDNCITALCYDVTSLELWCSCERSLYKYKMDDELKYVWKLLIDRGLYERAKLIYFNNEEILSRIISAQANYFLQEKRFSECVELFLRSDCLVEDVALKFIQANQSVFLREFLIKLSSDRNRMSQYTDVARRCIYIWILDLYLSEVNQNSENSVCIVESLVEFSTSTKFLNMFENCKEIVYKLFRNHSLDEQMLHFALKIGDFVPIVHYHLKQDKIDKVFAIIFQTPINTELCIRFSHELFAKAPSEFINQLLRLSSDSFYTLCPDRIIEELKTNDLLESHAIELIRFIEECVINRGYTLCAQTHDHLVLLYCRFRPQSLYRYLKLQGNDAAKVCYSVGSTLTLCFTYEIYEACVHVLCLLSRFEEAVLLSLKHKLGLAKSIASLCDSSLSKRLWLMIVKDELSRNKEGGVANALKMVNECNFLNIEDILPFLPNFTVIDTFKEAVTSRLQELNAQMNELRAEMNESTQAIDALRDEVDEANSRDCLVFEENSVCDICSLTLFDQPIYAFMCKHSFHRACLMSSVQPYLSPAQLSTLLDIQHRLSTAVEEGSGEEEEVAGSEFRALLSAMEEIVACQCLYCGDYAIRDLDNPLTNSYPGML